MKVLSGQDDMCRSLKIMTVMISRLTTLIANRKNVRKETERMECDELTEPDDQPEYDDDQPEDDE